VFPQCAIVGSISKQTKKKMKNKSNNKKKNTREMKKIGKNNILPPSK
jgi:hypothetical protein